MLEHKSEPVWGLCEWKNTISKPKIKNNREPRAKNFRKTVIEKIRERREAREHAEVGR